MNAHEQHATTRHRQNLRPRPDHRKKPGRISLLLRQNANFQRSSRALRVSAWPDAGCIQIRASVTRPQDPAHGGCSAEEVGLVDQPQPGTVRLTPAADHQP